MRDIWIIKRGPPVAERAVTIWPDGTYVGPSRPDPHQLGGGALKQIPGVVYPGGDTPATAQVNPQWFDLDRVSMALRQLQRFRQCRIACKRHFANLPADIKLAAMNNPDFAPAKLAVWGGPYGAPPPKPPRPKPGDWIKNA